MVNMEVNSSLKAVFLILFLQVATGEITKIQVSGCHKHNVTLNCPLYLTSKSESDSVELEWKFQFRQRRWKKLAAIEVGGNKSLFSNNTGYNDRVTLHPNGSLVIESLKPEDEREYLCRVGTEKNTKQYMVQLNVTCSGKVTEIKREVCVEEDVVLDCDAMHRTNPRKLKRVTWHVKNESSSDSVVSWSPIVDSEGSTVKTGNGFKLNENGSLFLQGHAREQSETVYRCEASKKVDSPRELHLIVLKNIKCGPMRKTRDADKLSPFKVCIGHPVELACPLLHPVNISHVRSMKWRVRRTGSPKHFQQLFHVKPKKTANATIFVQNQLARNATRLHDLGMGSVGLGPNGSLLIKSVRAVEDGDYECIVKTFHHQESHRYLIRVKPMLCNHTTRVSEENVTAAPTTSEARPATIKTTAGRVAMTTSPSKGQNISMVTDMTTPSNNSVEGKGKTLEKETRSADRKNQTSGSKIADSLSHTPTTSRKQDTIKSSTSTSTWTMVKPSSQTIKTTTRVTMFTTFSSAAPGEEELDSGPTANAGLKTDHFVCGGVLSDPIGGFQSPNFPSAYPANSRCQWNISVPQQYTGIVITLDRFDLEHEEDCRRDYVAIYDELGNQVGPRHCGIIDCPAQLQVKGRVAVVLFQTDTSLQKAGFKLTYKSAAREI